jgi:hypothetical protein
VGGDSNRQIAAENQDRRLRARVALERGGAVETGPRSRGECLALQDDAGAGEHIERHAGGMGRTHADDAEQRCFANVLVQRSRRARIGRRSRRRPEQLGADRHRRANGGSALREPHQRHSLVFPAHVHHAIAQQADAGADETARRHGLRACRLRESDEHKQDEKRPERHILRVQRVLR